METAFRNASGGNAVQSDDRLIQQARYLLDKMLAWQEEDFKKNGGVRERMHAARTEVRGEAWDKAVYSMLALAKTPDDLESRLSSVINSARRAAWSIGNRNGWNSTRRGS